MIFEKSESSAAAKTDYTGLWGVCGGVCCSSSVGNVGTSTRSSSCCSSDVNVSRKSAGKGISRLVVVMLPRLRFLLRAGTFIVRMILIIFSLCIGCCIVYCGCGSNINGVCL